MEANDADGRPVRRRRRRATAAQGPPAAVNPPAAPADPSPTPSPARADANARRKPRRRAADEATRSGDRRGDLAGSGQSQVGVSGALRARDVNRPTDEDLAAAEAELVIVRRNWRPDGPPGQGRRRT